MPKFRCPRCGAIVEGLHDRCPRCNVLFKYRKEDMDLLTPYKAPVVEQPEKIEERPAPEPLPEPVAVEEVKAEPAPVVEEPAPAPVEEKSEVMVVEESKPLSTPKKGKKEKKVLTPEEKEKAGKSAFKFGLAGFILALLATFYFYGFGLINILPIIGWVVAFPCFIMFLLGLIFCGKAIGKAKKSKGYPKSKGGKIFGVLGLVLSILGMIALVVRIFVVFLVTIVGIGIAVGAYLDLSGLLEEWLNAATAISLILL